MPDILVRIDATTAQFDRALSQSQQLLLRYETQLRSAQKAQLQYDAAVAEFGATSAEAVAAQHRLGAALARTTEAEIRAAVAAKKTSEIQTAASAKAAAAAETQAAAAASASAKAAAAAETQAAAAASAQKSLASAAGKGSLVIAAAFALATKAAADYEAKIAKIRALAPKANDEQIGALKQANQGYAQLGISASEAADAEVELIKAGVSVKDILGGALTGTLNLAAAGQLNVADAASIAAQAMTQFGLAGKDLPRIADDLSAGANKALGSVQDLGIGLSYAGGPAHLLGVSLEETVATLAEFAQGGLLAEKGGAALQTMFARLEKPTAAAQVLLDKYSISLYDAQGNFVGMSKLAGELHDNLSGLSLAERTAAFQTIFGNRAFRAAAILYQDGAKGAKDWADKIHDAGNATRTAHAQLDSLSGSLDKLKAQIVNTAISFGEPLQKPLKELTDSIDGLLKVIEGIPAPIKEVGLQAAGMAAALGAGVFVFSKVATGLASLRASLLLTTAAEAATGAGAIAMARQMLFSRVGAGALALGLAVLSSHVDESHTTMKGLLDVGTGLAAGFAVGGPFGAAVGGAAGLFTALSGAAQEAGQSMEGLGATINANTGALTDQSTAFAVSKAVDYATILKAAGISTDTFTQALLGNKDAIQAVKDKAIGPSGLGGIFGGVLVKALGNADDALDKTREKIRLLHQEQLRALAAKGTKGAGFSEAAGNVREMGGALEELPGAASRAKGGVDGLTGSVDDLTLSLSKAYAASIQLDNAALGRRGDWLNYKASIDAVAASLKQNGRTLRVNTEEGRANRESLDAQASAALKMAADFKSGSAAQVASLRSARAALYDEARQFNMTKEEARSYVNQVLGIPKSRDTDINLNGIPDALEQLREVKRGLDVLNDKDIHVNVYTQSHQMGTLLPGGAAGGFIRGPGTPTSDSIPAWLSDGEFVVKAAAVSKYGLARMFSLNNMTAPVPRFADGGGVGRNWSVGGGTYMTDPGVVGELRGIRIDLRNLELKVHQTNVAETAGVMRSTADLVSRGNIRRDAALAELNGRPA